MKKKLTFAQRVRAKIAAIDLRLLKNSHSLPELKLEDILKGPVELAPPILEKAYMPPYKQAFDDDTHDDFNPLNKLAKFLDPEVVVELGTAHGNTVANLALNCPRAKIYTVNAPIETMTGNLVTFGLTKEEIGIAYRNAGFADRVTQIFENTLHMKPGEWLGDRKMDFGIVDACHDTDYVINDFLKLEPFASDRGVIVLHDTHASMRDHLAGSYLACMKLRRRGYDIRHIEGTWWGVWCKDWSRYL